MIDFELSWVKIQPKMDGSYTEINQSFELVERKFTNDYYHIGN